VALPQLAEPVGLCRTVRRAHEPAELIGVRAHRRGRRLPEIWRGNLAAHEPDGQKRVSSQELLELDPQLPRFRVGGGRGRGRRGGVMRRRRSGGRLGRGLGTASLAGGAGRHGDHEYGEDAKTATSGHDALQLPKQIEPQPY